MKKLYDLIIDELEPKTYSLKGAEVIIKENGELISSAPYCNDVIGYKFLATNVNTDETFRIEIVSENYSTVEERYLSLFINGNIDEINEMTWEQFKDLFTDEWYK